MLYLVRHGRTASNAARLLLGRMDVPLDELGRRQAAALGATTFLHQATRVVSSPLARAVDTAAALGPPVTIDDRWIEIDYGIYDGSEVGAPPASCGPAGTRTSSFDPLRESHSRSWAGECERRAMTCGTRRRRPTSWWSAMSRPSRRRWRGPSAWTTRCSGACSSTPPRSPSSGPGRRGPTLRSFNETAHRPGS